MIKTFLNATLTATLATVCLTAMPIVADDSLHTQEIKSLIVGNAVEETNVKWGYVRKFYFEADGSFRRVDENGNKDNGSWEFEKDGILCLQRIKRRCWRLTPKADGSYEVRGRSTGVTKKIWRIKNKE